MKSFTNEIGNKISIEVTEQVINGVDGILIAIEGPTSQTEVHVTRMEAKILVEQLNDLQK